MSWRNWPPPRPKRRRAKPLNDERARTVALTLVLVALGAHGCDRDGDPKPGPLPAASTTLSVTEPLITQPNRPLPKFELIDHRGEKLTRADLIGTWTILFFGFTHCPDVCPATLGRLKQVWSSLSDSERQRVQVLFVSVDPDRDDQAALGRYIEFYQPEFKGARGDSAQLDALTKALDASYELPRERGESYNVDHSSALFLINPKLERVGFFSSSSSSKQIVSGLRQVLQRTESDPLVEDAWIRAAPAGAPVLAGYFALGNPATEPITVVSASSPEFDRVELHETRDENGQAKMRAVERLKVPAGGRVQLEPGGHHLMLIGPKRPITAGERIGVELQLTRGGPIEIQAVVRPE